MTTEKKTVESTKSMTKNYKCVFWAYVSRRDRENNKYRIMVAC